MLRGRDRLSGVRRLELLAVNDDGRQVVAAVDVCDVGALAAGESCPASAEERIDVDVGDLPDGATRFEARALDLAGWTSRDGESWSTYVDHTPPGAPTGLTVLAAETDSLAIAGIAWRTPPAARASPATSTRCRWRASRRRRGSRPRRRA